MNKYYLNKLVSRQTYQQNSKRIKVKSCYRNVFSLLRPYKELFASGKWKVVYCYVSALENLCVRHCAILEVESNTIINATIYATGNPDEDNRFYFITKQFDTISEYLRAIDDCDGRLEFYDLLRKIDADAYKWAVANGYVFGGIWRF